MHSGCTRTEKNANAKPATAKPVVALWPCYLVMISGPIRAVGRKVEMIGT
jgi:hypothetical protein